MREWTRSRGELARLLQVAPRCHDIEPHPIPIPGSGLRLLCSSLPPYSPAGPRGRMGRCTPLEGRGGGDARSGEGLGEGQSRHPSPPSHQLHTPTPHPTDDDESLTMAKTKKVRVEWSGVIASDARCHLLHLGPSSLTVRLVYHSMPYLSPPPLLRRESSPR